METNFKETDDKINKALHKAISIKETFESRLNPKKRPFLNETNINPQQPTSSSLSSLNELDHTKFKMETQLSENFSFIKAQKCLITFVFPEIDNAKQNSMNIHGMLKIDLLDSQHNKVKFSLNDKFSSYQHFIQICFTPAKPGIHYLSILFKENHIANSPFHFVVLSDDVLKKKSTAANGVVNNAVDGLKKSKTINQKNQ